MKEFIEKLKKKLYENVKSKGCPDEACWAHLNKNCDNCDSKEIKVQDVIRIANELAEEYKDTNVSTIDAGELLGNSEQVNDGWIPCSEKLPKENQTVIACFVTGSVCILDFYNGLFHGIYDYTTKVIIAWQPLPAPYQPKGE